MEGVVQTRPASQVKKNKPTGAIEVIAENIKTLNKADWEDIPLVQKQHFNPNSPPATAALRLKYRHLDLRRPLMQRNLRLRASVTSAARSALESFGFVDVETHFCSKARRKAQGVPCAYPYSGAFLGIATISATVQTAVNGRWTRSILSNCQMLPETSGRADRQPEFTQLDIEMSFVDANDVIVIVESVVQSMVNASRCILDEYENAIPAKRVFEHLMLNQAITIMSATLDNIMSFRR